MTQRTVPSDSLDLDDGDRASATPLTSDETAAIDHAHARLGESYYELLGVGRTADRPTVRAAYFEQMKRFHPDVFWNRALGGQRAKVEAVFHELTSAFEVLCDPRRRAEYDQTLTALKPAAATAVTVAPPTPPEARPLLPTPPRGEVAPEGPAPSPSQHPARMESVSVLRPTPAPPPIAPPTHATPAFVPPTKPSFVHRPAPITPPPGTVEMRRASPPPPPVSSPPAPRRAPSFDRVEPVRAEAPARPAPEPPPPAVTAPTKPAALAALHEREGRWSAAVDAWTRACAEAPRDVPRMLSLVNAACEGLVELPRADEYARRATQADPRSADAWVALARVSVLTGRMTVARQAVSHAITLAPTHGPANELARRLKQR